MFSGIIEEAAEVISLNRARDPARLVLRSALDHSHTAIGDSICVGGVCLTVVQRENNLLSFDVARESARRSVLGSLVPGARVNLERSLKMGDRIHGHLVFGHVDTTAELIKREREGESDKLTFRLPPEFLQLVVPKGSIAVSGVSLTVGEVGSDWFTVYIIPHTLAVTTLADMRPGARVNIELDMLARYVRKILSERSSQTPSAGITEGFLAEYGYLTGGSRK